MQALVDDMAGVGPASSSVTWGQLAASNASACAPLGTNICQLMCYFIFLASLSVISSGVCRKDRCQAVCPWKASMHVFFYDRILFACHTKSLPYGQHCALR